MVILNIYKIALNILLTSPLSLKVLSTRVAVVVLPRNESSPAIGESDIALRGHHGLVALVGLNNAERSIVHVDETERCFDRLLFRRDGRTYVVLVQTLDQVNTVTPLRRGHIIVLFRLPITRLPCYNIA